MLNLNGVVSSHEPYTVVILINIREYEKLIARFRQLSDATNIQGLEDKNKDEHLLLKEEMEELQYLFHEYSEHARKLRATAMVYRSRYNRVRVNLRKEQIRLVKLQEKSLRESK